MPRNLRRFVLAVPAILTLAGCVTDPNRLAASSNTIHDSVMSPPDLGTLTYRAVDLVLAQAPEVSDTTPLVVSSIADERDLGRSSPFGNIVADMIRDRLAQTGHTTSEVRMRAALQMKPDDGEFALSRNRAAVKAPPVAAALFTGTYAVGYQSVYVSIRLISASDSRILAGADFVVPRADIGGMLRRRPG